MDSRSLAAKGFNHWHPFNREHEHSLLTATPYQPGVYVIRRDEPYKRSVGQSDIAYIGSAANASGLNMRLRQYFHPGPTQGTNRRILALVEESTRFEVSFVPAASAKQAKALEADLFDEYEAAHGELPPENLRH